MSTLYLAISHNRTAALFPGSARIEYGDPLDATQIPHAKRAFAQIAKKRNLKLKTVTPSQLETLAKRRAEFYPTGSRSTTGGTPAARTKPPPKTSLDQWGRQTFFKDTP